MADNASMNEMETDLSDFSLDDNALFAELDTEINLDGAGGGGGGNVDLNFDLGQGPADSLDFGEAAPAAVGHDVAAPAGDDLGGFDLGDMQLGDMGGGDFSLDDLKGDDVLADMEASDTEDSELRGLDDLGDVGLETLGGGQDALNLNLEEEKVAGADGGLDFLSQMEQEMPPTPQAPQASEQADVDLDSLSLGNLDMPQAPDFQFEPLAPSGVPPQDSGFTAVPDVNLDDFSLDVGRDDFSLPESPVGVASAQQPQPFAPMEPSTSLEFGLGDMAAGAALGAAAGFAAGAAASKGAFTPQAPSLKEQVAFTAVPDVNLTDREVLELNLDAIEPVSAGVASAVGRGQAAPAAVSVGQDLLMTIPHQLTVELGSVALSGRDLLDLQYGSVVRLDRAMGETVDLVLEGRKIARGEVVLINGKNLGVRIVELKK